VGFWRESKPFGSSILYATDPKGQTKILNQGIYDTEKESEMVILDFKTNNFPKRGLEEEK
jgi:hypothetical protein